MNTINGNNLYTHRVIQQTDTQNHIRNRKSYLGNTTEQMCIDVPVQKTQDAGISTLDVYERLGGSVRIIPEAGQDEDSQDVTKTSEEVRESEQLPAVENKFEIKKIIDIGIVSLPNGISFHFNEDTGEVSCVNDYDRRPGIQVMWSKVLSSEEQARCDRLFDNYKDVAAGQFVFRYRAYLKHEEFWDMYLDGKVDLSTLVEMDDKLSEDELYNKFIQDIKNHDK